MATINPFYRFEDAIEVPSISRGAKKISDAMAFLFLALDNPYAGNTIASFTSIVSNTLEVFNSNAGADFEYVIPDYPAYFSAPYNAQVFVYSPSLISLIPLHKISIVLELNSSGIITNSWTSFPGAINADYNYSPALFDGEREAYKSLTEEYQTGAAIFPKYYQYDSTNGIATSAIARFQDCKFNETIGLATRSSNDVFARDNRFFVSFPYLDGEAKYILALFEQLYQIGFITGTTITQIYNKYNSWTIPEGYSKSHYFDYGVYDRLQINIFKPNGQGISLVVREESGFKFQRFFAPEYLEYNLLNDYTEGTELPYETSSPIGKYADIFYDFEECEFQNCNYPEKEVYPMPIMGGDNYQFNIDPYLSNLFTSNSVSIGLFDENYKFIQKIGETSAPTELCCDNICEINFEIIIPQEEVSTFLGLVNDLVEVGGVINFQVIESNDLSNFTFFNGLQLSPIVYDLNTLVFELNDLTYIDCEIQEDGSILISYNSLLNAPNVTLVCPEEYVFRMVFTYGVSPIINTVRGTSEPYTCINQLEHAQHQATVIIPSVKNKCYRFGLYKYCTNYDGLQFSWSQQLINAGANYVFAILDQSNNLVFAIAIPNIISSWSELTAWLQSNLPFANVLVEQSGYLTITVFPYLNFNNYSLTIGTLNFNTGIITPITLDEGSLVGSPCDENINEVYAFSNLLNLDNSDCFSQIIQYWVESPAVAEGFEYYEDWFQQVRLGINGGGQKPILTDSVYRQSNGIHRRPSNKQDLSIDLHTDFLDLETQCALVDATRHTNFVVNGQNLFVNGDIEVATIQDFSTQSSFEDLAQVKFSALIQGYQPKNSTCINC